MKVLLLLALFFLIPSLTKAQEVKIDTIKLPISVAKTVAKELTGCDSLKAVHKLTVERLLLTEQKVGLKDNIIAEHVQKGIMYENIVKNNGLQLNIMDKWAEELRKENKKLKVKLTFIKITLSAIIGTLTYLYITK